MIAIPTPSPEPTPAGLRPSAASECLVTGATGLVGNNVVRMLVNRGENVRVLVRPNARPAPHAAATGNGRGAAITPPLLGLPVDTVAAGLLDLTAIERAVAGVTSVIHAAAIVHVGWRHLDEMRRVNVEGTRIVARAARLAGARLVHVSSVDALGLRADGGPADEDTSPGGMLECPYVVTKREAEQAVLAEVDRGIYATHFGGGQVDITSGKFVFSASEAYLVEKGKIICPIKGTTLIGNGPDVMQKVKMLGNDFALDDGIGTCGKDGQSVPVGVGQPSMLIASMTVGGTAV